MTKKKPRFTETYADPTIENIIDTDWHRNGSGTEEGFVVSLFDDPEQGRMVMIDFGPLPLSESADEQDRHDEQKNFVAVLNVEKLANGAIGMHSNYDENDEFIPGTGGNAWRGGIFAHTYRPLIREFRILQEKARDARFERSAAKAKARRAAAEAEAQNV